MKKMKRVLALVLALVMSLGLLAGCGGKEKTSSVLTAPDRISAVTAGAFTADEVVFRFRGDDITGEELVMKIMAVMDRYHEQFAKDFEKRGMDIWQDISDIYKADGKEYTFEECLMVEALNGILTDHIVLGLVEEAGLTLTDAQKKEWDEGMAELKDKVGEDNLENVMFLANQSAFSGDLAAEVYYGYENLVQNTKNQSEGELIPVIKSEKQEALARQDMKDLQKELVEKLDIAEMDRLVMEAKGAIMAAVPEL